MNITATITDSAHFNDGVRYELRRGEDLLDLREVRDKQLPTLRDQLVALVEYANESILILDSIEDKHGQT